jgi:hypothetical protein
MRAYVWQLILRHGGFVGRVRPPTLPHCGARPSTPRPASRSAPQGVHFLLAYCGSGAILVSPTSREGADRAVLSPPRWRSLVGLADLTVTIPRGPPKREQIVKEQTQPAMSKGKCERCQIRQRRPGIRLDTVDCSHRRATGAPPGCRVRSGHAEGVVTTANQRRSAAFRVACSPLTHGNSE